MKCILAFLLTIVAGLQQMWAQEADVYNLWIAGTQVTSENKGDVLGTGGTVSFDPGTNILTLNGVSISSDEGIESQMPDLSINVQGENTITTVTVDAIYLKAASGTATILGNGTLVANSRSGVGIHTTQNLLLKDGVKITANSYASHAMQGSKAKRLSPYPTLTMQGSETKLTATVTRSKGSLVTFSELILNDGLEILEPEGAEFLENVGIVNSGATVATTATVVIGAPEPETYAVLSDDGKSVTFYYDTEKQSRQGAMEINNKNRSYADGNPNPYGTAVTATFDASFADFRPTSTAYLFDSCFDLTDIFGMEYLHTEDVTDMTDMFDKCYALTSLDLSGFNTAKVTSMSRMFEECRSLKSLDLSSFNTSNVTNMHWMFYLCNKMKVIKVSEGWSTESVVDSNDMFFSCSELVGGAGTTYNISYNDASYAHIDGGPSNPGYFTDVNAEPVPVLYKLLVAGTIVKTGNKDDVLGDGTVRFDPETSTLTLTNANILTDKEEAIYTEINLNIVLEGENTLSGSNAGIGASSDIRLTISGPGSLYATGSICGIGSAYLTIKDNAQVKAEGGSYGIYAAISTFEGEKTIIMMKGKAGAISSSSLTLNDDLVISMPEGARFKGVGVMEGAIVDAKNNVIKNEWVIIASQDYITGISQIVNSKSSNNSKWYNLAGQQIVNSKSSNRKLPQGIVIKDGRKVLMK